MIKIIKTENKDEIILALKIMLSVILVGSLVCITLFLSLLGVDYLSEIIMAVVIYDAFTICMLYLFDLVFTGHFGLLIVSSKKN